MSRLFSYDVFKSAGQSVTKRFYALLSQRGPAGLIAIELFRAQKASSRAKVYRGGNGDRSYRDLAYDRKGDALRRLCAVLQKHRSEARLQIDPTGNLSMLWGWKEDSAAAKSHRWVLYVVLPHEGQVSFHSVQRYDGPDFPGEWDGRRVSTERILGFCERVLAMDIPGQGKLEMTSQPHEVSEAVSA